MLLKTTQQQLTVLPQIASKCQSHLLCKDIQPDLRQAGILVVGQIEIAVEFFRFKRLVE